MDTTATPPAATPTRSPRVGVAGLGLIGGSVARLLTGRGLHVTGYDPNPGPALTAWAAGQDMFTLAPTMDALSGCDVVFLCAPTKDTTVLLAEGNVPAGDGLILDVCSVKGPVVDAANVHPHVRDRFVGAHPLTGKAETGFASSSLSVLACSRWVTTPDQGTPPARVVDALTFLTTYFGSVSVLSPSVHDQTVAVTSGMPHLLGQALSRLAGHDPDLTGLLAGPSFRSATRVVSGDRSFPADLVWDNKDHVLADLPALIEDLIVLHDVLARDDQSSFRSWFTQVPMLNGQSVEHHRVAIPDSAGDMNALVSWCEQGFSVFDVADGHLRLTRQVPAKGSQNEG